MSTKSSIRHHDREGELPAWQLYREAFEKVDVVNLEIEGVLVDVTMIDRPWGPALAPGTVALRLPVATAKQLGLVPPAWEKEQTCANTATR
jgi:hypothetical protein